MMIQKILICYAWTLCFLLPAAAAPFDKTFEMPQSDGTTIQVWGQGDEFYAIYETLDGYAITLNPDTGFYHYAELSPEGDKLLPTGPRVGTADPLALGIPKHLRISHEARDRQIREGREKWQQLMQDRAPTQSMPAPAFVEQQAEGQAQSAVQNTTPTPTTIVGLTVLVKFNDSVNVVPKATIETLLNSPTGNSCYKFYNDTTNGLVQFTNIVTDYITMPKNQAEYTSPDIFADEVFKLLMQSPNYSTEILPMLNNLTISPNGRTATSIFYHGGPHLGATARALGPLNLGNGKTVYNYSLQPIEGGNDSSTIIHESGHSVFNFPDLYNGSGLGIGAYCVMSRGGGLNHVSQFCAYLKYKAGWATIIDIDSSSNLIATLGAQGSPHFNKFYRYRRPGVSTEYFLIENRQKAGRDSDLPSSGIMIWHVDELGNNGRSNLLPNSLHDNYEVSLEQADGLWELEKSDIMGDTTDPYYNGNPAVTYAGTFDDFSTPSANWWDGTPSGMHLSNFSSNGTEMTFQVGNPQPHVIGKDATLVREGYAPVNNVIDPGETVTVRFNVRNSGFSASSNAIVTLLAQGGVSSPSSPQSLGMLAAQTDASVDFTFTASTALGETLSATLRIEEASKVYGTFSNTFTIGEMRNTFWTQNFDSVTAPNLPSEWTSTASIGTAAPWRTSTSVSDTHPNAAFIAEGGSNNSTVALTSPVVAIAHSSTQLSFRHSYNTERDAVGAYGGGVYGGGVLEIKIGENAWQDIIIAGGSWVTNGYNVQSLDANYGNPLGFRSAWGGVSNGFITTLVNLPPNVGGKNVQFRWLYGYDRYAPWDGSVGWYVDTISLIGPVAVSPKLEVSPRNDNFGSATVGQTITRSFVATNSGAQSISGTISIPAPFSIVGSTSFNLAPNASTTVNVIFAPQAAGSYAESLEFNSSGNVTISPILTGIGIASDTNQAPVANAQSVTTVEATPVEITLTGSDADDDPLTFVIVDGPEHGVLSGSGANRTYIPAANHVGADSFTFRVNDGIVDSAPATISITVTEGGILIPWSPLSLRPLAWYDSADTATITSNGGAVSHWNDKSGQGYHATQTNSALRPVLVSGGIQFGSNNAHLIMPKMASDAYTIMMVMKNNNTIQSSTAAQMPLSIEALSNGPAFGSATAVYANEVISLFDEDTAAVFGDRQSASSAQVTSISNVPHLYSFVLNQSWHIGMDGSGDKRDLTSGTRNPFLTSRQVGAIGTNIRKRTSDNIIENAWTGLISEVILLPTAASLENRQKIEGYLAHKWDSINGNTVLVSALPENHPWKSEAPECGYRLWAGISGYNLSGGPNDDDDGDRLTNLYEFSFGTNPTQPDGGSAVSMERVPEGLTVRYRKTVGSSLMYTFWTSPDLVKWTRQTAVSQSVVVSEANGTEIIEATLTDPPSFSSLFLRVRAE